MLQRLWQNYSLGVILCFLWLINWIFYGIALAAKPGEYSWRAFWEGTFENSTSEFLQLFTFVVLSRYFIFRDSPQSKDGSERHERKTDYLIDIVSIKDKPKPEPVASSKEIYFTPDVTDEHQERVLSGTRWGGS